MVDILSLVVLALIGEAVWETLKMTWQAGKLCIDRLGALFIGILLAFGTGLDLMTMVGIPIKIPYIGLILTGLLISRGANFMHDLLGSINNVHQSTKQAVLPASPGSLGINTTANNQQAAVNENIVKDNLNV